MEGLSLVILKEELNAFKGKRVLCTTDNTKQTKEDLRGRELSEIETWGKVLKVRSKKTEEKFEY